MRIRCFRLLAWPVAAALLLTAGLEQAQVTPGINVSDVVVPIRDKDKLKAMVTGKNAKPQKNGLVLVDQFRMESYREGDRNKKDLIIEAPEGLFNPTNYDAGSSSQLRVRMGDGRFSIEGAGWAWRQQSDALTVSNRVHTVFRRDLLGVASSNAPGLNLAGGARQDLAIFSDHFQFDARTGLAIYRENVRASDQNQIQLSSGQVTLKVPPSGGRLDSVSAERDVRIEATDPDGGASHALADQAVYRIAADGEVNVELAGNPSWQSRNYSGQGDVLFFKPQTREFSAKSNAWARLPRPGSPAPGLAPANAGGITNQFVEVHSDEYELKSGTAVFRGHVRARQEPDWTLSSGRLTATFSTNRHELQKVVAEQTVVLELKKDEEPIRANGQTAVYTLGEEGGESIELTGYPTWETERYEGSGAVLRINPASREFKVSGEAILRLLAGQTPAGSTPSSSGQSQAPVAIDQPLEVFSDAYELRGAQAEFRGHVLVNHPEWKLTCGQLCAKLAASGNALEHLDAEEDVMVAHTGGGLTPPKPAPASQPLGAAADHEAPWTLACQTMALQLGATSNRIEHIQAQGNIVFEQSGARVTGNRGEYDVESDRIRLSEGPTLTTADGTRVTGANVLVFNRRTNSFEAIGHYRVEVPDEIVNKRRGQAPRR